MPFAKYTLILSKYIFFDKQKHRSAFLALSQAKQFACSRVATSYVSNNAQTMRLNQSTERGKSAARRAQKSHAFAWLFKWLPE